MTDTTLTAAGGGGSGWELVDSDTASASASLIFDSVFSGTGYEWRVRLVDLLPASDNVHLIWTWRAAAADETGSDRKEAEDEATKYRVWTRRAYISIYCK
jgi:hypothetical protein